MQTHYGTVVFFFDGIISVALCHHVFCVCLLLNAPPPPKSVITMLYYSISYKALVSSALSELLQDGAE